MSEPVKARSATAMAYGERVILQITGEDGAIYTFEIAEPALTLDSLRQAESGARVRKWRREIDEDLSRRDTRLAS